MEPLETGGGNSWPSLESKLKRQIGELGGSARSAAKSKASRENGTRGGRPKDKEAA
jgi:hypothetical protein